MSIHAALLASPKSNQSHEEVDFPRNDSLPSEPRGAEKEVEEVKWTAKNMSQPRGMNDVTSSNERRPTYIGYIKTPADAILLLAACDLPDNVANPKLGPPPRRISRRLLDDERAAFIRSGAIFVWDEREAGMRRWTDGRCWSASRVSGCFLTYRELEMRKKTSDSLGKDAPRSNLYKSDGLVKQSFSIRTSSNRKLHVISYYNKDDIKMGYLQRVSKDPRIMGTGPDSWNVQIDENEYGELLSREASYVTKRLMSPQVPAEMPMEKVPVKRRASEKEALIVSERDVPPSPEFSRAHYPPRLTYPPPSDYHYGRPHLAHTYLDESSKRCRYEKPSFSSHSYYHASRGWISPYDTPSYLSPVTPPTMDSKNYFANVHNTHCPPVSYVNRADRFIDRPTLPAIQGSVPRASEAERGTLEALASLRADTKVPPVTTLDRSASYHLTMPSFPASRLRARPAPVPVADRHTLQKTSVPFHVGNALI